MSRRLIFSSLALLPVAAWFIAGCDDRSGRTPTEPDVNAQRVENDGSGNQFKFFGSAAITRDPENPTNVVLEVVSDGGTPAGAYRDLNDVQLWQLDHQLNFHRAFVAPHTCGGGSPRIQLIIDANGDGEFVQAPAGPDFVAHGHVRPPYAACETSAPTPTPEGGAAPSTLIWRFEDLTDELIRWEITPSTAIPGIPPIGPIGGAGAVSWDALELIVSQAFPDHEVLRGIFLEDFNPTPGIAYYDLITIFDLTIGSRGQVTPERRRGNL